MVYAAAMSASAVTLAGIPIAKRKLLDEIVASLRPTQNLPAIVLGGSHARGTHRPDSDLDIGLVYRRSEPFAIGDIRAIVQKFSSNPAASVVTDFHEWGPWVNGGAWIYNDICKVDLLYRDLDQLEITVREARSGIWRHDFDQQPPFGFRSVIYLGELACCVPLFDPAGLIAQLKAEIEIYPEALKRRIVGDCLWSVQLTLFFARDFADHADIVNSAGCMTRIAHYLTQALFALNDTYFINDKGAVTRPFFVGCLNCLWLPIWFPSNQPPRFSFLTTSRLSNPLTPQSSNTHCLHTYQFYQIRIERPILPINPATWSGGAQKYAMGVIAHSWNASSLLNNAAGIACGATVLGAGLILSSSD